MNILLKDTLKRLQSHIKVNGRKALNQELVSKFMQIKVFTMVIGSTVNVMEKVLWPIRTLMSIVETGKMVKKMVKALMYLRKLDKSILEHSFKVKWLVVNGFIQTEHFSKVDLTITSLKEMEHGHLKMEIKSRAHISRLAQ